MRAILFILLTVLSAQSYAGGIEKDKKLHFGFSTMLGLTLTALPQNRTFGFSACMGIGLGKELLDEWTYGGFDEHDLVWDAAGCALGTYLGWTIMENDKKKKARIYMGMKRTQFGDISRSLNVTIPF